MASHSSFKVVLVPVLMPVLYYEPDEAEPELVIAEPDEAEPELVIADPEPDEAEPELVIAEPKPVEPSVQSIIVYPAGTSLPAKNTMARPKKIDYKAGNMIVDTYFTNNDSRVIIFSDGRHINITDEFLLSQRTIEIVSKIRTTIEGLTNDDVKIIKHLIRNAYQNAFVKIKRSKKRNASEIS